MNRPDWDYSCGEYEVYELPAGEPLVRIYNHADATANGYTALNYNKTIRSVGSGGRFDAQASDPYGYLYGACTLEAAIHETLLPFAKDAPARGYSLAGSDVEDRSWCVFFLNQPVRLVSLCDGNATMRFKAKLDDIIYTRDYSISQEWSRYIRSQAPEACGMSWRSHPQGEHIAFILFDDRMHHRSRVLELVGEQAFDTPIGRQVLAASCARANCTLSWP